MEGSRESIRRSSARRSRRSRGENLRGEVPRDKVNRKFFYIAAGSILLALVAFLCGVQMGRSLSEVRGAGADESGAAVKDQAGKAPPFRVVDRGKEVQPVQEARNRAPAPAEKEKAKERESAAVQEAPRTAGPPGPPAPAEKNPPEEEKPSPPKARYSLQVAALNNSAEAQQMVDQLKKKGYEAYQVTGTAAAKGTLHRVRIGHFQTLQEARQFVGGVLGR